MDKNTIIGTIIAVAVLTFGFLYLSNLGDKSSDIVQQDSKEPLGSALHNDPTNILGENINLEGTDQITLAPPQEQEQGQTQQQQQPSPASQQEQNDDLLFNLQDLPKDQIPPPTTLVIDTKKTYHAILQTTEGNITIELFDDATPRTANNFVYLAKNKFYDNTIFHRVIQDFMIQGGDPLGTGAGGPGYRFGDEPFEGRYNRGIVAMANAGPNTNGSQFFIMHQDYDLPPQYVIFGKVIEGMEVVDSIATADVAQDARGESSSPVTPVTVQSVQIQEL